jgi:glycosyltransferase involved in cell wall biosynthesis
MPTRVDLARPFDDTRGLTGSEISVMMSARQMAMEGMDVTLVGNFNLPTSGTWEGVRVISADQQIKEVARESFDVAFAWLDPNVFDHFRNVGLRVLNQQVNDFSYCHGWENKVDVITSPAKTHRDHLSKLTSFPRERWLVWPNAIDPQVYYPAEPSNSRKLVYASSPDRALHWVLELFPKLRRRVPDVELAIFYNWASVYEHNKQAEHEMACRLRYSHAMLKRLQGHGVVHKQSVSKNQLVDEMRHSRALVYPCDPVNFTEGFSVTTMEALALGCLPVIVGADALDEIYGQHVPTLPAPYRASREAYLDTLERALVDDAWYREQREKALSLREVYNWETTTKRFLQELSPFIQGNS